MGDKAIFHAGGESCLFDVKDATGAALALKKLNENLTNSELATAYFQSRGIDKLHAVRLGFGFCEKRDEWSDEGVKYTVDFNAIIFPIYNAGRLVGLQMRQFLNDLNDPPAEKDILRNVGSKNGLFGVASLYKPEPSFICADWFDFLAFYKSGYNAVILIGADGANIFLAECQNKNVQSPLILSFDYEIEIRTALKKNVFNHIKVLNIGLQNAADLNKFSLAAFESECNNLIKDTKIKTNFDLKEFNLKDEIKKEIEIEKYTPQIIMLGECDDEILEYYEKNKRAGAWATPFEELNLILNGGFKARQLYALTALPSLGKTAFALQCTDFLAAQGKAVIYFSLEIPWGDLVARSISRLSFLNEYGGSFNDFYNGVGSDDVIYKNLSEERLNFLFQVHKKARNNIMVVGRNFKKYSGNGVFDVFDVKDFIKEFIKQKNVRPFVVVDYFQILQSENERITDKQKCDEIVAVLKETAVNFEIPILAISSLNRQSYSENLTMSAFKETGSIEYTCDALFGMQIGGVEISSPGGEPTKADLIKATNEYFENTGKKEKELGKIEFKIMKNRNGVRNNVNLFFSPLRNCFYEKASIPDDSKFSYLKNEENPNVIYSQWDGSRQGI